jgi:hypothetical protein
MERGAMLHARRRLDTSEQLTLVVEELLGALDDTARLAAGLCGDWRWQVQLGYLRDLQRLGRETLAAAADEPRNKALRSARGVPAARRFRSSVPRRGPRRCARNGHGDCPA